MIGQPAHALARSDGPAARLAATTNPNGVRRGCNSMPGSAPPLDTASTDLARPDDVEALLRRFYGRVFLYDILAAPFTEIRSLGLESHLPVMCDFWETVLFRAGLYRRNTLHAHRRVNGRTPLSVKHFQRWLTLWNHTIDDMYQGPIAEHAKVQAARIASAMHHRLTGHHPSELNASAATAVAAVTSRRPADINREAATKMIKPKGQAMTRENVQVRRIYDEPTPADGTRVLVDRIWPRGMTKTRAHLDQWCKEIAPSTELRKWYHHDPARFEEFTRRYRQELTETRHAAALKDLRNLATHGTLTLLTATTDVNRSEAAVLADLVRGRSPASKTP